jgi:uncharacterized protein (DUF305 family)
MNTQVQSSSGKFFVMFRYTTALWLALAAVLAPPALAQSSNSSMAAMSGMSQAAKSPADDAMMAGMSKMNHDMAAAPMTGNPDQDFVAMMVPHHQGAVSMAEVELRYGHDPFLRKLAQEIIAAQRQEIAEMTAWQKQHTAD